MPTPESEAFLAKKPTVPPTFSGVDFFDNQRLTDARDAVVREQFVKVMMARLVGEELGKCYIREGVNHLEKCGKYRDRYMALLKETRERGYRGRQQNYEPGDPQPKAAAMVTSDYPTVQNAKGALGTEKRRGITTGFGPDGLGSF